MRELAQRRGFTLLELMVAIVISGLVSLLAYASMSAGIDTLERVDAHKRTIQTRTLARPLLTDALRHIADAGAGAPSVFQVLPSAEGKPSLTFLTRGVESPLGASGLWQVTVALSYAGLTIHADALEQRKLPGLSATITGVHDVRFRFLPTKQDRLWVTNWEAQRQHPYAVKIEMLDARGEVIDGPLVVATSFQGAR